MKIIDINGADGGNFNLIFINAIRQFWRNTKSFQCIRNPKNQNLLLYLNGCKITYTDKSGEVIVAESGDLVYTPEGSEYSAVLSDFASPDSHTVGINFLLFDGACERAVLSDKITIINGRDNAELTSLIYRLEVGAQGRTALEGRIILLDVLSRLLGEEQKKESSIVSECIRYLTERIDENPSVTEIAKHLGVSEVYLRRRFKESMGTSPTKYKNELRLERSVSYLKFGEISVQEISDTLGYATVSHFIKEFKERYGLSPLQYRKKECE